MKKFTRGNIGIFGLLRFVFKNDKKPDFLLQVTHYKVFYMMRISSPKLIDGPFPNVIIKKFY